MAAKIYPKTKADLVKYLQLGMENGFSRYKQEKKLEYEAGLLKTFFIEADYEGTDLHRFLKKELDDDVELLDTEEEDYHAIRMGGLGSSDLFFLDRSDKRFWVFHTFSLAKTASAFTDRVSKSAFLDTAWLPMQFLQDITTIGQFKGFAGKFDNNVFEEDAEEVSKISMRLWGNLASEVVKTFHENKTLARNLSISGVRVKTTIEGKAAAFVVEDLNYKGKTVAIGDSVLSHFNFVEEAYKRRYKQAITQKIEAKHAIYASNNSFHGEPIFIEFNNTELEIRPFTKAIFSSANPFRIWGLTEVIKDDFARVYAVDMHVGAQLRFEIFKDSIRIFLDKDCCGNSIARFFTLFQQHYDASARLVDGDGNDIF